MKTIPVRHIADADQQLHEPGRFIIRNLSDVLNGMDLAQSLHKHDFFFILAVQKGKGFHEIDFVRYDIEDHAVFILRPGQVHQLHIASGSTGYLLEFDPSFYPTKNNVADQRWKKATANNYCRVEAARFKKLLAYLSDSLTEYELKQDGYREAIKALLDLFCIEYVRESPKRASIGLTTYAQERYEELLRLLEANITQVKSVAHYAQMLNLSVYQLNAVTKSSVGKSAAQLINAQIILEAQRYLLATSSQIKDIAWHLGYEDPSYFIRFFKKHTGHSPDAFRKLGS